VHVLSSIVRPSLEGVGWPPREHLS
jgi:hypothetical protein